MKEYDPARLTVEDMDEIVEHGLKVYLKGPEDEAKYYAGRVVEYDHARHYRLLHSLTSQLAAAVAEAEHMRLFIVKYEGFDGYRLFAVESPAGGLYVAESLRRVEPLREPCDGVESTVGELKSSLKAMPSASSVSDDGLPERDGLYYADDRSILYQYSRMSGWTVVASGTPLVPCCHHVSERLVRSHLPLVPAAPVMYGDPVGTVSGGVE